MNLGLYTSLRLQLTLQCRGGLCANSLLFRYDVNKAEDGVGGEEGAFSMCTLWAIEALSRAAQTSPDGKAMLKRANRMFDELCQSFLCSNTSSNADGESECSDLRQPW